MARKRRNNYKKEYKDYENGKPKDKKQKKLKEFMGGVFRK